ncbi:MAG: DNA-3-methyladenine glycosylase 2 family protein [Nitrosomonas sp.]|jgi:DNA-3-methyladenine glycosylase II
MTPIYWQQAVTELSLRDPILCRLFQQFSEASLGQQNDAFTTLARAIVGQQISVKAAASIWKRVCIALPEITPPAFMAVEPDLLRDCGLSARKINYLQDLAGHFEHGLLGRTDWSNLPDEELIRQLVCVRGVGRWTAEMFLIFHLHRPDVLPLDDIGLQRAISIHYNGGLPMHKREINAVAQNWQPWRSVATWYLWRSLDPFPVIY